MRAGKPLRHAGEAACWAAALTCALYGGFARQQAHAAARALPAGTAVLSSGAVLGRLRIPELGLAVPVVGDDDHAALLRGVGHIPGTALPGGLGTVGLAGHRDTFLRPLAGIRPGMAIEVSRGPSAYTYRVDRTEIVRPEQAGVLATADAPELVLVTCYPFHYIGAAPLRFIVYAHLVSLTPGPAVN